MKNNFLLNIFSSYFSIIITSGISLLAVPITLHYFGPEKYGIFSLTNDTITYLGLFNFGIPWATSIIFVKLNSIEKQNQLIKKSIILLLAISIIFLITLMFIEYFNFIKLSNFIKINPNISYESNYFFIISIIMFFIRLPLLLFSQLLIFIHKNYIIKFMDTIFSILTLLILLYITSNKLNMVTYATLLGIIAFIINVINLFLFCYFKNNILLHNNEYNVNYSYKAILTTGYYYFINSIGVLLIWNSSSYIIAHFLNLTDVTKYSILFKIFNIIFMIITQLMNTINPVLANYKKESIAQFYNPLFYSFKILSGIFFIILFGGSKIIILIWLHNHNIYAGELTNFFIALYCYTLSITIIPFSYLGVTNPKSLYKLTFLEAILNILLSIILIKFFKLTGISISLFLSHLIANIFMLPGLIKQTSSNKIHFKVINFFYNFFITIIPLTIIIHFINISNILVLYKIMFIIIIIILYLILNIINAPTIYKKHLKNIFLSFKRKI
jgi:O-antigen/teichoic acid export membrane protein